MTTIAPLRLRPASGSPTKGRRESDKPWALFVSLVRPHFPLTAPPEFYALYPPERMPMPRLYDEAGRSAAPRGVGAQVDHEL